MGGGVLDNRITVSGLLASRRNTALTADIRVTNNQCVDDRTFIIAEGSSSRSLANGASRAIV